MAMYANMEAQFQIQMTVPMDTFAQQENTAQAEIHLRRHAQMDKSV